jgi:hypothetical protein
LSCSLNSSLEPPASNISYSAKVTPPKIYFDDFQKC